MKNSLKFLSFGNGVATYDFAQQIDASVFGLRGRAIGVDVVEGKIFLRVSRARGLRCEVDLAKLKEEMGVGFLGQIQTLQLVGARTVSVPGGFVFAHTPMSTFTLMGRPGIHTVKLSGGSNPKLSLKHFWLHTGINLLPLAWLEVQEYFAMLQNPLLREVFDLQTLCGHQALELDGMAKAGLDIVRVYAKSQNNRKSTKRKTRKLKI